MVLTVVVSTVNLNEAIGTTVKVPPFILYLGLPNILTFKTLIENPVN